jgi:hypothetical protein
MTGASELRCLVTGNKEYGLAQALAKHLDADFVSRSNDYDLSLDEGMDKCAELSTEYDCVFINCYTEKMNNYSQARLLHKIYAKWLELEKGGHLVCIGSISDTFSSKGQEWIKYLSYGTEKLALKDLSHLINQNRETCSPNISCSYVSLGHMHTPYVDRLHPDERKLSTDRVATLLKWVLEQPEFIEEIRIVV